MPLGWVSLLPMILVAVAAPVILWKLPRGSARRYAAAGLASIFLAHAGLYILWASRLACWVLVGLAAVVATYAAAPHRRAPWIVTALAALALGIAFQLTPEDTGLVMYVAGATPLLIGGSLGLLASASLARSTSTRSILAVAALAFFGGLVPLTSYWPTFLLTFEPLHIAPLALALVGLSFLAAARPERPTTWGEIAARAGVPLGVARGLALLGALLVAGSGLSGSVGPLVAALVIALGLGMLRSAAGRLAIVSGLALGLSGLVAAEAALDMHVRVDGEAFATVRLAAASIGASALAFAFALSLAAARDEHARDVALTTRGLPPDAHVVDGEATPDAVRAVAAQAGRGRVGVLRVRAPAGEPWWTLPTETYEALLASGVHAAIVDGAETSIVPPFAEVEGA